MLGKYSGRISKGLPQQAEVAQGVLGRLRPRIFLTFRHYKGGRSSAICTGCLYPRRNPWYSLSEAESPVTPLGIDPGTSRLVAQCLKCLDQIMATVVTYFSVWLHQPDITVSLIIYRLQIVNVQFNTVYDLNCIICIWWRGFVCKFRYKWLWEELFLV